jgi:uncharacterized protein (DUF885 family)
MQMRGIFEFFRRLDMQSLKKTLLTAALFLGSFSSDFIWAEDPNPIAPSLELRLQQLLTERKETERLHHLFDLYWDWRMAENPDEASFVGYPEHHDRWQDLSEKGIERRQQFMTQFLEVLASIDITHLEMNDKVSYDILKRILEEERTNVDFGNQYLPINQMHGIHLYVPLIIELMPHQTVTDYENILSRLRLIPELFQQTIHLLEKGIELGITSPRIAILNVPKQILNQIVENPLKSSLLKGFQQFPSSIPSDIQLRLLNEAQTIYQKSVVPALLQLYTYVTEKYLPHCRKTIAFTALPKGQEWYTHLVQSSTTTQLTPQEIHNIGLKEVERIHQEMLAVIQSTQFKGTFEEFLHFIKTDRQFYYSNREDLLKGYQTLTRHIESKLPLLFAQLPSLPFEVLPIPSYTEESQIAAYYCPGSVNHKRPGVFFINTSYPEKRAKWEMEPLSLHEAVPGHHLQITLAQEIKKIPEFRKNTNFTAYIEGWGLYAESLGLDLGLYQDSYSNFGRLSYEMMRAIRLVVDTGMHAMGWSREQAIAFFKQHVGMSDHEIMAEVDRYLVMPGQALAYKIGELKIKEMRRLATEQLGEKFDIRAFHHAWLEHGTLPLDIAENQIHQWIQQSKNFTK